MPALRLVGVPCWARKSRADLVKARMAKAIWVARAARRRTMAGMNPQKAFLVVSASLVVWLAGCSSPSQQPTVCLSSPALVGGLGSLPLLNEARTRSISAENLNGAKGQGGMAIPNPGEPKPAASARAADNLGQGWKVKPFLRVNAGETVTLMDVDGPGLTLCRSPSRLWAGATTGSISCCPMTLHRSPIGIKLNLTAHSLHCLRWRSVAWRSENG